MATSEVTRGTEASSSLPGENRVPSASTGPRGKTASQQLGYGMKGTPGRGAVGSEAPFFLGSGDLANLWGPPAGPRQPLPRSLRRLLCEPPQAERQAPAASLALPTPSTLPGGPSRSCLPSQLCRTVQLHPDKQHGHANLCPLWTPGCPGGPPLARWAADLHPPQGNADPGPWPSTPRVPAERPLCLEG